jgi:hypothetical protein
MSFDCQFLVELSYTRTSNITVGLVKVVLPWTMVGLIDAGKHESGTMLGSRAL